MKIILIIFFIVYMGLFVKTNGQSFIISNIGDSLQKIDDDIFSYREQYYSILTPRQKLFFIKIYNRIVTQANIAYMQSILIKNTCEIDSLNIIQEEEKLEKM